MLIKIEVAYIVIVFSCYLTGVYMQNPSCTQIDFNFPQSVLQFKQCENIALFAIRSYENVSIEPFRSTSEYHLANIAARSCFATKELYNLNEYSEINAAIYLNSNQGTEFAYVDIIVIDMGSEGLGSVYWVATVDLLSNEWNEVNVKISEVLEIAEIGATIKEAMIEIRSYTGDDTILAIEYINILNPRKAEQYCRRVTAPPATTDPVTDPPITGIPTTNYPVTYPPVTDPPVSDPPVTDTPVMDPPVTNPPVPCIRRKPYPVTDPSVTDPPVTHPPVTDPPVTDPPETDPRVTDPPVTDPPVTDPLLTDPPITDPPVTCIRRRPYPVTDPSVTDTPITDPPVTDPPVTCIPTVPVEDCEIRCSLNTETDELKNQVLQQGRLIKELYEFVSNYSQRIFELEKIIMGE